MNFKVFAIVMLALVASAAAEEQCSPVCKWQCDDPSCPAVCHPVCERPQCQMQCEEVQCAKCTVHCAKPVCTIRCPTDGCGETQGDAAGCPKCESVCQPAQCHTTCKAPPPRCSPVCEELKCANKCVKPTNCAKPKCELQCAKPACAHQEYLGGHHHHHRHGLKSGCCSCSNRAHAWHAFVQANEEATPANAPSFIESLHTFQHRELVEGEEGCCPCSH